MQAVSYSIKITYVHQFPTGFNNRFDLVRDQVLYPEILFVSRLFSIPGSPPVVEPY
jgi:hypothetical protein